jgi:hypothetical protein
MLEEIVEQKKLSDKEVELVLVAVRLARRAKNMNQEKNMWKKSALAVALSTALVGCGSSSSSNTPAAIEVSGTAEAPGGVIAYFEQKNAFEIAMQFFVSPVAAAITGLQPVTGATVELIRVDAAGNQVGDVLATTATSITGDYTLTLPTGVDLSGDLIVRITGTNNKELRAQVVETDVDITPLSEFVLQSFVNSGTDLTTIETGAVVQLSSKVEEFDLVATGVVDIDQMLAQLDAEVGDFVENQIETITTAPADDTLLNNIAGDYHASALSIGLHDDDNQYGSGTFAVDLYRTDFTLGNAGSGTVSFTISGEEEAYTNFSYGGSYSLFYATDTSLEQEVFTSTISSAGVVTIESEFEEDIDGDFGWRWPPAAYNLQKVSDHNIFSLLSAEAGVRYLTIDTNEDNVKDAVDPDAREGDEVFRGLEIFAKKGSGMTNADLNGDYGRVYLGIFMNQANGSLELETESNILSFDGPNALLDETASDRKSIFRDSNGTSYTSSNGVAGTDISYDIAADGEIATVGGSPADGFVSGDGKLIVFGESVGTNAQDAEFAKTLAIKLPSAAPSIDGSTYRVQFMGVGMLNSGDLSISNSSFGTKLTMSSATEGTLSGVGTSIEKSTDSEQCSGFDCEVTVTKEAIENLVTTVNVEANGKTTITVADGTDSWVFDGWFNEGATYGVFVTNYGDSQSNPDELGMAVLTKIVQ